MDLCPPHPEWRHSEVCQMALQDNQLQGESHHLLGILELQSPLVKKCFEWVNKFKLEISKKGEVSFKFHSILTALGERIQVIKAAVELFVGILDQHESKMAVASK